MALQKSMVSPQGFEAKTAYIRVEEISIFGKTSIQFSVRFYKDAAQKVSFKDEMKMCDYDIEGANPFAQAYNYLKTLPEFAGAIDC